MNTKLKEIAKTLREQAVELKNGNEAEKQIAGELSAIAGKIEAHIKANERPVTEKDLEGIRLEKPDIPPEPPLKFPDKPLKFDRPLKL